MGIFLNDRDTGRCTVTLRRPGDVLVLTLHENLIRTMKSLVLSVSVRLTESRSEPISDHAAVSPSPLRPACPTSTQTS